MQIKISTRRQSTIWESVITFQVGYRNEKVRCLVDGCNLLDRDALIWWTECAKSGRREVCIKGVEESPMNIEKMLTLELDIILNTEILSESRARLVMNTVVLTVVVEPYSRWREVEQVRIWRLRSDYYHMVICNYIIYPFTDTHLSTKICKGITGSPQELSWIPVELAKMYSSPQAVIDHRMVTIGSSTSTTRYSPSTTI